MKNTIKQPDKEAAQVSPREQKPRGLEKVGQFGKAEIHRLKRPMSVEEILAEMADKELRPLSKKEFKSFFKKLK